MKILTSASSLILSLLVTGGCSKKKEEASTNPAEPVASTVTVSSKTGTSMTLTWLAATDDATAAADLEYKVVSSTVNTLDTVQNAEDNGTLVMDWTPNTLTTNLTGLTESTLYYIAVLVRDADDNKGVAATAVTMLCAGKKMYLATASNANLGGKAGADGICLAQRPAAVTGSVKAVLADNTGVNTSTGQPTTGRQACYGNCNTTSLYVLDWPLAANTSYCTPDLTQRVGRTGVTYHALTVTEANILSTTSVRMFMGFNIYWGNSYGSNANNGSNCVNWTSTAGTYVGGATNGTGTGFVAGSTFPDCADPATILCAEQ